VILLRKPWAPKKLSADIHVPAYAAARLITILLDGREVISVPVAPDRNYTIEWWRSVSTGPSGRAAIRRTSA